MKMELGEDAVRVSAVEELGAANANAFRDWVRAGLTGPQKHIEIDLSQTTFLDSCGLGALVALHKTACSRQGRLRLLNPLPPVRQILELTQLDRVFETVTR
jgi:anti-sigma B factor antagonist